MTAGVAATQPGSPPPGSAAARPGPAPAPRAPAPETAAALRARLANLRGLVRSRRCPPLPAAPATVAAFLAAAAAGNMRGGRARPPRRGDRGPPPPSGVCRSHRRSRGPGDPAPRPPRRHAPPQATAATRPVAAHGRGLSGRSRRDARSRAAAARRRRLFPRAALVGLDAEHVRFTANAVELTLSPRRGLTAPSPAP